MFRTSLIAFGIALIAGPALAAGSGSGTQRIELGVNSSTSLAAQFRALDQNGDGVISRREARVNPALLSMYDSLDTSQTIEDRAEQTRPGGLTMAQYEAGMQAAAHGGVVGQAVSGGGTYILMKNGQVRPKQSGAGAGGAMNGNRSMDRSQGTMRQDNGGRMNDM